MADGGGAAPVALGDSPAISRPRSTPLTVRNMRAGEADELGAIFFRAVHHGAARAYTEAERDAWAPQKPDGDAWETRLCEQSTVVVDVEGRLCGFMSLSLETGYLDLAYLEKHAHGSGAAEAMYLVLENRARAAGLTCLISDASHLAQPFLLRRGWTTLCAQTVERNGVTLQNWRMEKTLP